MSTPISWGNSTYNIPAFGDSGYAQGAGNLSQFLVSIPAVALQISGGTYNITSDFNFGSNYGLISKYFTSRSSNAATAGAVRLAIGDTIDWGTGNLALGVNAGVLTFNGGTFLSSTAAIGGDLSGFLPNPTVATVGTSLASAIHTATVAANAATNVDTPSTIVARDSSGNFSAGTITANLTGNVSGSSGSCTGNSSTATSATTATAANALNSATTTVVVNGAAAPTNGQVLTATSSIAAAWTTPTVSVGVANSNPWFGSPTTSRATSTVYQNLTGKTLFVSVVGFVPEIGGPYTGTVNFTAYIGPTSSPSTLVSEFAQQFTAVTGQIIVDTLHFIVPNNYYYEVTNSGTINMNITNGWTEWN